MSEAGTFAMQVKRFVLGLAPSCRLIAVCLVLLAANGCREKPTTVSGKVTLDGQPLSNTPDTRGTVVFHPNGGQGTVATALLDPTGEFNLAVGSSMEIPPGNYNVTVSLSKSLPQGTEGQEPNAESVAPRKYASARESGLTATVAPGENHIDFDLSSNVDEVTQ
jgi:hypothetical protein